MADQFERIEVTVRPETKDPGRIAGAIGMELLRSQERIRGASLHEIVLVFERPIKPGG